MLYDESYVSCLNNLEVHEAGESQIDFDECKSVAFCSFVHSVPLEGDRCGAGDKAWNGRQATDGEK